VSRNKTQKFADLKRFENVFDEREDMRNWLYEHDYSGRRLTVELACGKGEYTLALAQHFADQLFVGIDLKGARLWAPARVALERKLSNCAFLRTRIEEIGKFFETGEIDEIWITFPDPYRKASKAQKRLTSVRFLDLYRPLLNANHLIHFKTDHLGLFEFSQQQIGDFEGVIHKRYEDLHAVEDDDDRLSILTTFERRHILAGKSIKYLCFTLPPR
jgi:tRNA (guanine-N7-)-methyltransferase